MTNKQYTIPNPKEITKKDFQEHHKWLTHNFEQDKNNQHIFHKKENNNITNDNKENNDKDYVSKSNNEQYRVKVEDYANESRGRKLYK